MTKSRNLPLQFEVLKINHARSYSESNEGLEGFFLNKIIPFSKTRLFAAVHLSGLFGLQLTWQTMVALQKICLSNSVRMHTKSIVLIQTLKTEN